MFNELCSYCICQIVHKEHLWCTKTTPSVLCEGALNCFFTRSGDYLTGTNSSPDILFEIWFWKKKSVAGTYKLQSSNFKTWTFLSKMKEHPPVTFWMTPDLLEFLLQPFHKIVHKNIILVNTNLHLIPLCYLLTLLLIQSFLLRNNSMFTSLFCLLLATSPAFENILSISNKDAASNSLLWFQKYLPQISVECKPFMKRIIPLHRTVSNRKNQYFSKSQIYQTTKHVVTCSLVHLFQNKIMFFQHYFLFQKLTNRKKQWLCRIISWTVFLFTGVINAFLYYIIKYIIIMSGRTKLSRKEMLINQQRSCH